MYCAITKHNNGPYPHPTGTSIPVPSRKGPPYSNTPIGSPQENIKTRKIIIFMIEKMEAVSSVEKIKQCIRVDHILNACALNSYNQMI